MVTIDYDRGRARELGQGEKLKELKVWAHTKELISLAASSYGVTRVQLFHRMVEEFLEKDGRLALLENVIAMQKDMGGSSDDDDD